MLFLPIPILQVSNVFLLSDFDSQVDKKLAFNFNSVGFFLEKKSIGPELRENSWKIPFVLDSWEIFFFFLEDLTRVQSDSEMGLEQKSAPTFKNGEPSWCVFCIFLRLTEVDFFPGTGILCVSPWMSALRGFFKGPQSTFVLKRRTSRFIKS